MAFESGLSGKVAIVTGGSRGIGRAIVELLAGQGANVTFFYRGNQAAADEVVAGVHAAGGQATAMQVDVSDSAACAAAVEAVAERCERIDILVNNAGIVRDNLMAAMEDDEISDVLNTNVGGVFNVTRPVIPYMMSSTSQPNASAIVFWTVGKTAMISSFEMTASAMIYSKCVSARVILTQVSGKPRPKKPAS